MPFAAAISEHPVPATALGEVVGQLLEEIGVGVDLVCFFVTPQHAGALEDMAAAVQTILDPQVLIGCAAEGVVGPGIEVEHGAAVSMWGGNVGPVESVRLEVVDAPGGGKALAGWPIDLDYVPAGAILIGDPFTFPAGALFDVLNRAGGFPRVTGGMASAARGPGGNRLVLGDQVYSDGAIGVLIGAGESVWIENIVAQGCRPIGTPYVVTRCEGNVIYELGGKPALARLNQMVRTALNDVDMGLAQNGLLVGLGDEQLVVDEQEQSFASDDFLIRTLLATDPLAESLTIGDTVSVGTTLQFHVRDSEAASIELETLLADRDADATLLFTSNGRGSKVFEVPSHDAGAIALNLESPPTAGFFTTSEFGPMRGANLEHGFSASLALFTEQSQR